MKKLLTILLLFFMIGAYPQWVSTYHKADPLKGQDSYTSYMYIDDKVGAFVFWDCKEDQFRISNYSSPFSLEFGWDRFTGKWCGATIKIGFYNENDSLEDKEMLWLEARKETYDQLETRQWNKPLGQKKKVQKLLKWIEVEGNYVRILAPSFGGNKDFDLIIPTINKENLK